jgi:hypothetical protein
VGALLLWCATLSGLCAQSLTEEETLAVMIRGAARESVSKLDAPSVSLQVRPRDAHPMIAQIFSEEAAAAGAQVFADAADAATELTVDVRGMRSSAVSLGKSSYLQSLSASFGVLAVHRGSAAVLWSREYRLSKSDTLLGQMPESDRDFRNDSAHGWMESILTPILVTAAAGIIIVLLFTVRGS